MSVGEEFDESCASFGKYQVCKCGAVRAYYIPRIAKQADLIGNRQSGHYDGFEPEVVKGTRKLRLVGNETNFSVTSGYIKFF